MTDKGETRDQVAVDFRFALPGEGDRFATDQEFDDAVARVMERRAELLRRLAQ